jgi:hypothetical protein
MVGQPLGRNKVAMPIRLPGALPVFATPPDDVRTRVVFHYQNGSWTEAPPIEGGVNRIAEPSKRTSWLKGGFALRGEELWAASTDGAIRISGDDWHVFPESLERAVPRSIHRRCARSVAAGWRRQVEPQRVARTLPIGSAPGRTESGYGTGAITRLPQSLKMAKSPRASPWPTPESQARTRIGALGRRRSNLARDWHGFITV